MRALAWCCLVVALSAAVLLADDHSIIFDEDVDFSIFKTFAMREGRVTSERPELNFPAAQRTLAEAIRTSLTARGLKEVADKADLYVEHSVAGVDYGIGPAGRANVIQPGGRGRGGRASALQVDFTEATLVIDLKQADRGTLVWRGVYRDKENDARRLAEELPKDATKLLSQYPPSEGSERSDGMRWRLVAVGIALLFAHVSVAGDDLTVQVDPKADLSVFKTFTLRTGKITSPRPELDNPLFLKKLGSTIRAALTERGLKETPDPADLLVDFSVAGEDFSMSAPPPMRGAGPQPLRFTQGTLEITLTKPGEKEPIWRGIYRDDESTGSTLMLKLPEDAKKLIARYPRLTK